MHDDLIRLADEYWDGLMAAYPTTATLLGDHRFDDRIEDWSAEAEDRLRAEWVALAERVDAVDPVALGAEARVTHTLLRSELALGVEGIERRLTELA
jgi:uncharacterized protein (DUF885 family)